jgi:hypothetical protein
VRQLEVVAVSDDGTYVLLASAADAARATHSVRIEGRLQAAIRGELDESERRESELSPKEIQARLRAGESEEQIAKLARVPVSRVIRYAGPVISERDRIVEQARGAVLQRPRAPEASIPLGRVVEKRLGATAGIRFETVAWTARRRDDGAWIVVLGYVARGGSRTASWLWKPADHELTSLNGLATRLGAEDAPAAVRRKRAVTKPAAKRAVRKPAAAKRPAAKRPAPKRTAAAAKPKPAAKRTTAKRAVKPRPAAKPVAKSSRAKPNATRTVKRAAGTTTKPRRTPRVMETPVVEPVAKRSNGRVAVPSWSDVLLGVQAPTAARGRRRS